MTGPDMATVVDLDAWRARRHGPPVSAEERTLLDRMPVEHHAAVLRLRDRLAAGDRQVRHDVELVLARAAGGEFGCCAIDDGCAHHGAGVRR